MSPNEIPPFRPIVSLVNTYNYRLANNLLRPHIPNAYTISDTFFFVQELNTIDLFNKFMVSFDAANLFTNIPPKESIYLAYLKETLTSTFPKLNSLNYSQLLLLKLIFFLMVKCLIKLMVLPRVLRLHLC